MDFLRKEEAIEKINRLASGKIPFIFIIDYSQENSIVMPVDETDPRECLFDFNGTTNDNSAPYATTERIEWQTDALPKEEYAGKFKIVTDNQRAGNSYLANLTCRIPVRTNIGLHEIFKRSRARYRLWLKDRLVCFSPETFVTIRNNTISSCPMKGTIDATLPDAAQKLMDNPKEAAEHATIVDLIRNDLSMVAEKVHVARYRYAETIATNKGRIIQTSSEICGNLDGGWNRRAGNIIFSQLPAGSITGAPKRATMQIIAEAEAYDRGFYTGIMGFCDGNILDSAVMIRFIDEEDGKMYFKAGGGITAQSNMEDEYNEMIQKTYVPIY